MEERLYIATECIDIGTSTIPKGAVILLVLVLPEPILTYENLWILISAGKPKRDELKVPTGLFLDWHAQKRIIRFK